MHVLRERETKVIKADEYIQCMVEYVLHVHVYMHLIWLVVCLEELRRGKGEEEEIN